MGGDVNYIKSTKKTIFHPNDSLVSLSMDECLKKGCHKMGEKEEGGI